MPCRKAARPPSPKGLASLSGSEGELGDRETLSGGPPPLAAPPRRTARRGGRQPRCRGILDGVQDLPLAEMSRRDGIEDDQGSKLYQDGSHCTRSPRGRLGVSCSPPLGSSGVSGSHLSMPLTLVHSESVSPARTEGRAFQNRSAASRLLLSERLEAELLAANTRLEHEARLTGGEDRHAVLVFDVRRRTLGRGYCACLSRQR